MTNNIYHNVYIRRFFGDDAIGEPDSVRVETVKDLKAFLKGYKLELVVKQYYFKTTFKSLVEMLTEELGTKRYVSINIMSTSAFIRIN